MTYPRLPRKLSLILVLSLMTLPTWGAIELSQSFTADQTIPEGNPTGLTAKGFFTQTIIDPRANQVASISLGIQLTGGYNGSLFGFLVAPNGRMVTLMDRPGTAADGFGAASSGMNITLADNATVNIQSVTDGYGTTLTGNYQPKNPMGTLGCTPDNLTGNWQLFLASTMSGGGNATLKSWTLDIHLVSPVPEPGSFYAALALLLLLLATQLMRQMDPRRLLRRPGPHS